MQYITSKFYVSYKTFIGNLWMCVLRFLIMQEDKKNFPRKLLTLEPLVSKEQSKYSSFQKVPFSGVFSGTEAEWKDYLNTIWFSKFWRRSPELYLPWETVLIFKYPQKCTTGPDRRWAPVDLSMFSLESVAREVSLSFPILDSIYRWYSTWFLL